MNENKNVNLYEVRKTVSFSLGDINNKDLFFKGIDFNNEKGITENKKQDLSILLENLEKFLNNFIYTFIDKDKSRKDENNDFSKLIFRKKLKIKYKWLKNYTKQDFHNFLKPKIEKLEQENIELKQLGKKEKQLPKIYDLSEIDYVHDTFKNYLNNFYYTLNLLKKFKNQPLESQNRMSECASYIRSLSGNHFLFIKEFVNSIHNAENPKLDELLNELKNTIKQIDEKFLVVEKGFLSSQSSGLQLAKASFNFYTLNKNNKQYFDGEETKANTKLNSKLDDKIFQVEINREKIDLSKEFIDSINLSNEIYNWNLDITYKNIKEFKSKAKNHFLEDISKGIFRKFENNEYVKIKKDGDESCIIERGEIHYENLLKFHPLFDASKENFDNFINLSNKIKDLNDKKQNLIDKEGRSDDDEEIINLNTEIKDIAKKRGDFFNSPNSIIIQTNNYNILCEFYKKIAFSRGQQIAKIKGLEQEKIDSQKTRFWSLIGEENNDKFLYLIPKEKASELKNKLEIELEKENKNGNTKIYYFKSLTLRALKKLCFKEYNNTFFFEKDEKGNQKLNKLAQELNIDYRKYTELRVKNAKNDLDYNFYQDVLKAKATRETIDIFDFGGLKEILDKKDYNSIEEFEIDLEKYCYIKKEIFIDEITKSKFINDFQIITFKINSQDLRIGKEKKITNHKNKTHTKYWLDFWKNENKNNFYDIRLNPEITIQYRDENEELKEKEKNNALSKPILLEKYRHRLLKEHFTLNTTISLNANEKKLNLAFYETKDLEEKINIFNDKLSSKNDIWYYGIDRGINELATLCLTKFTNEFYEVNGKKLNKPEFEKIEVYKLKDEYEEREFTRQDGSNIKKKVINNISYFIDDEGLFEKIETSCIDLTQAKLIKGKIILNGDKNTYLKLKELSAKRRIFELFSQSKINKDSSFTKNDSGIYIGENQIYWFTQEQKIDANAKKEIKIFQENLQIDIEKVLQKYLQTLDVKNKFEDIETMTKINHLRDAITANMVGVIYYLYKEKSYSGKICLENMQSDEHINKHFKQSNQDISRRLEWSLFKKFQIDGLVPPELKQTILLREEYKMGQFGIIEFVKIENTSKNCPYCENTYDKTKGHYICKDKVNCCFDSRNIETRKGFNYLDNSDKAAAYNVAKNGFINTKLKIIKKDSEKNLKGPSENKEDTGSFQQPFKSLFNNLKF